MPNTERRSSAARWERWSSAPTGTCRTASSRAKRRRRSRAIRRSSSGTTSRSCAARAKRRAEPVDPSSVDWDDADELKQLLFRQRPGPQNALGHVKFLFPNPLQRVPPRHAGRRALLPQGTGAQSWLCAPRATGSAGAVCPARRLRVGRERIRDGDAFRRRAARGAESRRSRCTSCTSRPGRPATGGSTRGPTHTATTRSSLRADKPVSGFSRSPKRN